MGFDVHGTLYNLESDGVITVLSGDKLGREQFDEFDRFFAKAFQLLINPFVFL